MNTPTAAGRELRGGDPQDQLALLRQMNDSQLDETARDQARARLVAGAGYGDTMQSMARNLPGWMVDPVIKRFGRSQLGAREAQLAAAQQQLAEARQLLQ